MHQISAQQDAIGFFTKLVFIPIMAKQDDFTRYTIRVPQALYAALDKAASEANRSVNAEIVERLSYAVDHPPSEWNFMLRSLQDMDVELDEADNRYSELARHAEVLNTVNKQGFDYQKRLMYHVLSYLDDIPSDLAIWAYDMIASVDREEFMAQLAKDNNLDEQGIRDIIRAKRDARRQEALEAVRRHLADKEDQAST